MLERNESGQITEQSFKSSVTHIGSSLQQFMDTFQADVGALTTEDRLQNQRAIQQCFTRQASTRSVVPAYKATINDVRMTDAKRQEEATSKPKTP